MAIIDNYRGILTVFVKFETPKGDAVALIEKLKGFYESSANGYPGLISVNYHAALDGNCVFNYAQWKSEEEFDAFLSDPKIQESMKTIGKYESNFTKTKVVFTT